MENELKKPLSPFDAWSKRIDNLAKDVPDDDEGFDKWLEEAHKEFEREWDAMSEEEKEGLKQAISKGDALAKKINEEKQKRKGKDKKVAKPKRKEVTI